LDCSLVSNKNFGEILPSNSLSPGPGEVGQGGLNVLYLWCHSQKICTPQPKNIFSNASYKTCRVFWAFDQVGSTYQTREIPAQSHVHFGVFFSKSPISARRQCVKMQRLTVTRKVMNLKLIL